MNKFHYIFNLIIYYVSWTGCLLLAAKGDGLSAALLVLVLFLIQLSWQWKIRKKIKGFLPLILILTITGSIIDTFLVWSGLVIFAANDFAPYITPPWMISIWMSFSLLIFATLMKLLNHYILVGVLSLIGFPIAYAMGVKMGAAIFPDGYKTCILIGLIWGFMLPICFYTYQRMISQND